MMTTMGMLIYYVFLFGDQSTVLDGGQVAD